MGGWGNSTPAGFNKESEKPPQETAGCQTRPFGCKPLSYEASNSGTASNSGGCKPLSCEASNSGTGNLCQRKDSSECDLLKNLIKYML